jgi:hypothetical protein
MKVVVDIILFGLKMRPVKEHLLTWAYNTLEIGPQMVRYSQIGRIPARCHFCDSIFGQLLTNNQCSHFPFYHLHCYTDFVKEGHKVLPCPVRNCAYLYYQEEDAEETLGFMDFQFSCGICDKNCELKEVYCAIQCGHVFHKSCAESRQLPSIGTSCVNPDCKVVFSLASVGEHEPSGFLEIRCTDSASVC